MTGLEWERVSLARVAAMLPKSKFCDNLSFSVEDGKIRVDASKTLKAFLYISPAIAGQADPDVLIGQVREIFEGSFILAMQREPMVPQSLLDMVQTGKEDAEAS